MNFFWMILIGMTAGWLARQFMTSKGFGVIGALIGGALSEETGFFAGGGLTGSLIVATIGAIILLHGVRMVKKV